MKKIYISSLLPAVLSLLVLSSCGSKESDPREKGADALFSKLCDVTKAYTDSLRNAADSAAVNALFERYEQRFDRISNDVAPETDLFMTEGQNDTILLLQRNLLKVRAEKLSARQLHLASDTIEAQSEVKIDSAKSKR